MARAVTAPRGTPKGPVVEAAQSLPEVETAQNVCADPVVYQNSIGWLKRMSQA